MADPFLAEIRIVGFNFAPRGWALCQGQLMSIAQNQALFSLLGTTYGGDGRTTFALPDMRGRAPIHFGRGTGLSDYRQGPGSGAENIFLNQSQMASHNHSVNANSANANTRDATNAVLAKARTGTGSGASDINFYDPKTILRAMKTDAVSLTGGNQAHSNMQPYLAMYFCISLSGQYPSRS